MAAARPLPRYRGAKGPEGR